MMGTARRLLDRWRGSGRHAATVPPMDGILAPNQVIEEARLVLDIEEPDNLVSAGGYVLYSTRADVMRLPARTENLNPMRVAGFDSDVSALAAKDGVIAVGLETGGVRIVGGNRDGTVIRQVGERPVLCPTALLVSDNDSLIVALGSQHNPPSLWRHDLMQKNASGSVWRIDLGSGEARCLADRLAWPCGILKRQDGSLVVSESWRSRILELKPDGGTAAVLSDIAGYPGRLADAPDGGAWLSVFAPRSQLVEFVLREDDYRLSMMAEVDPQFWIAPLLSANRSFLEPMQLGGLKQLGMIKPWSPTRSYGLVIGLDEAMRPRESFHSRADGRRHGITSALEIDGALLATSKGGGSIVSIDLERERAAA